MKQIALATSAAYPSLTEDDQTLIPALSTLGISAEPAIWSDAARDWSRYHCVVLRSCWDYHLRLPAFLDWLAHLESKSVRIWNPPTLVRWNADKIYLRDLEAKEIPIIPTIWPDASLRLQETMGNLGWDKAVVKPRVSATAHKTCLTSIENTVEAQQLLKELAPGPGVLVQQFMPEIVTQGEWSLIFFRGTFSHAAIKTPKFGDFRVQHDYGGLERAATPPAHILDDATQVIRALPEIPLYARVDGVESASRLRLMELELIEPALFLQHSPCAADRFADAIVSVL